MTVGRFPDKPTPIGCIVGFLALFPAVFSVTAFWGASKAFAKEPAMVETGEKLIIWGIIALIPALLCIAFFIFRIASRRD